MIIAKMFTAAALLFTTLQIGARADTHATLTVRVDSISGAPRLLVNGKPRRARFFYGQPASGTIPSEPQGREVSFDFVPDQSATTATMHFRFGQSAGLIVLGDISVTDVTANTPPIVNSDFAGGMADFSREWHVWPPPEQNNVGTVTVEPNTVKAASPGLEVALRNPANGVWPDFHIYHEGNLALIKGHHYRVKLWIKSDTPRDITLAFYQPGNPYIYLGGPPGHYESEVRLAASAGVNFVSFSINMPWPAPGQSEDWESVDSVCDTTLSANPNALMLPRIPVYAPGWWLAAHYDEKMQWEDGDHGGIASPASDQFRIDASLRLERLIHHLESKYGSHIAGYHPVGQNTGEWFYMDSWNHPLNGYSRCDALAFRAWLRKNYVTVGALRAAWGKPDVSFNTAAVPSAAARHASPAGVLRDTKSERDIIDFSRFQQDSMADLVCGLAHVVRTATQGRKLVAFFFGYVYEFSAVPTGPACSGHYGIREVINCPDIDVLCSPISYFDRGPGESAPSMTAAESVELSGKMWLNEDDTRTYLTRENSFPGSEHVVKTLAETNGELTRNVAQESLRNFATWWMDLPASGWFDDPGMWTQMARLNKLDEQMLVDPTPFRPQVANVIDPASMTLVAEGGQVETTTAVSESRAALGRMGAPYGQYLLDDVAAGKVHAKLYYFADAFQLNASARQALLKATHGAVKVWSWAPGYLDGFNSSAAGMHELTGFDLEPIEVDKAMAVPSDAGRRLGLTKPFGVPRSVRPLFAAADAAPSETLAVYSNGTAAIAMRKTSDGISIFCGVPGVTPQLMRLASRIAGVHLFTQKDCCVYANGPFLVLHAVDDEPVYVITGFNAPITDVLTGEVLGSGPDLDIKVGAGQTRILRIRPGK